MQLHSLGPGPGSGLENDQATPASYSFRCASTSSICASAQALTPSIRSWSERPSSVSSYVTVTYELTSLGLSLQQLMCDVKAWAEAHMDEVLVNREKYDNRIA